MSGIGYIVREEYIRLAVEKATPAQMHLLIPCLDLITELDTLERTFPERLQIARATAGVEEPRLSRAASEEVSQSPDADQEFHRLLSRRCRRAGSAAAVVEELVTAVKDDLEFAEFLRDGASDVPGRQLSKELVCKKRNLLENLEGFLRQGI